LARFFSNLLAPFFKKEDPSLLQTAAASETEPSPAFYVQLAVYDSPYNPPRVLYISGNDFSDLTYSLANESFSFSSAKGGQVPYVAIKEVIENLIHASFKDVVVTILADGNTIRIADRGPGIKDKDKVFLPGFSTATSEMKRFIKGVGSGLTIAREAIAYFGGSIILEDNLGMGSVVTLHIPNAEKTTNVSTSASINEPIPSEKIQTIDSSSSPITDIVVKPDVTTNQLSTHYKKLNEILSSRQKKILLVIAEINETGPSSVAKELNMSLSTAYRELVYLEELKLVASLHSGKRKLTEFGLAYIGSIFE
jgi:hypothetical protein